MDRFLLSMQESVSTEMCPSLREKTAYTPPRC